MIRLWIDGQPPRKSNSRRVVRRGKRGGIQVIKSQAALDWIEAALLQIRPAARLGLGSLDDPLRVTMHVFYETRRPDLSGELVLDMLQAAGVIADDRYVYEWHLFKRFAKERPGVYILIEPLEDR